MTNDKVIRDLTPAEIEAGGQRFDNNEKMQRAATPSEELERQIMSWSVPKNEREWWALREIQRLRDLLAQINQLSK